MGRGRRVFVGMTPRKLIDSSSLWFDVLICNRPRGLIDGPGRSTPALAMFVLQAGERQPARRVGAQQAQRRFATDAPAV